jgi:apolipoprotein N-acyltransferase
MRPEKQPILAAIISGILLFLSFPGFTEFWPLAWIALAPMIFATRNCRPSQAAIAGLTTGFIHHLTLLYWVTIVLTTYGHLSWWVSWPSLFLLSLYMSVYFALFTGILNWTYRQQKLPTLWLGPFLWVALDVIRASLFTGFPWMDLAYSQTPVPLLLQTADITGHHGITFHIVLVNCLTVDLYSLLSKKQQLSSQTKKIYTGTILTAVFIIISFMGYNFYRNNQQETFAAAADTMQVAVIQGNIDQDKKWIPELQAATIDTYDRLTGNSLADSSTIRSKPLVIWPETALPFFQNSYLFTYLTEEIVQQKNIWLLTGSPVFERQGTTTAEENVRYYNSSLLISPTGTVAGRYDKQHLVPFGEYIPLRQVLPLPGPLVESIGDFSPGTTSHPLACQKARIGVLICFESIFPEIARQQVVNGANLLVNQTNDAWFGLSSAPAQHLSMAVLRAVETRRTLVRAANTGISAVIDHNGRIHSPSPLFEEAVLVAEVPLLSGQTIFVRFGYLFGYFCMLIAIVVMAGLRYFISSAPKTLEIANSKSS